MRPLVRAAPLVIGGLLGAAASAQVGSGPIHLTTVTVGPAPVEVVSGSVHVTGQAVRSRPLASGSFRLWGSVSGAGALDAPVEAPSASVATAAPAGLEAELPAEFALRSVYPNPLAGRARVPYELPEAAAVRLVVFDALGREVAVLAEGDRPAGFHTADLEAARLAPGLYHVRLTADAFVAASRFTVAR